LYIWALAIWHGARTATPQYLSPRPRRNKRRIQRNSINQIPLYPLRLEPIYQYRLWGGRRLANLLSTPLPGDGPIGEAWILSDRDEHASRVADGALKGLTIRELTEHSPRQLMGRAAGRYTRFPLLLKFLDVRERLSVQVHPPDAAATLIPVGETGKTEAWVVLEDGPESRIYAGLKGKTTAENLREALAKGSVEDCLASFVPNPGEALLVRAGTVHSLDDIVVFEVQENSDVTFRLYDWNHIDPSTGAHRPLQVDEALACIDYDQGPIAPSPSLIEATAPVLREKVIECEHFCVWRIRGEAPLRVGAAGLPRVIVCLAGEAEMRHGGKSYPIEKGGVILLPAVVGTCSCIPKGSVSLLEVGLPRDL
jgi:mannose-6-phosphate isomerase